MDQKAKLSRILEQIDFQAKIMADCEAMVTYDQINLLIIQARAIIEKIP